MAITCVTYDNCLIIYLKSHFEASSTNDRHSSTSGHGETLKTSSQWMQSGCWVHCLKNHTLHLDVFTAGGKYPSLEQLWTYKFSIVFLNFAGTSGYPSRSMPNVRKVLTATSLPSFSLFTLSTSLFSPLSVPPSNQPFNKPMRKWQRKCASDEFFSVSHWHGWVTPLFPPLLPVSARTYIGSGETLRYFQYLDMVELRFQSHKVCPFPQAIKDTVCYISGTQWNIGYYEWAKCV